MCRHYAVGLVCYAIPGMKREKAQLILGIAVRKASMPELFRLAKSDAGTLALVLRGIMRKRGYARPLQAMKLLEADLGYKNASPRG